MEIGTPKYQIAHEDAVLLTEVKDGEWIVVYRFALPTTDESVTTVYTALTEFDGKQIESTASFKTDITLDEDAMGRIDKGFIKVVANATKMKLREVRGQESEDVTGEQHADTEG